MAHVSSLLSDSRCPSSRRAVPHIPPGRLLGFDVGGTATKAVLAVDREIQAAWTLAGGNIALNAGSLSGQLAAVVKEQRPDAVSVGVAGWRTGEEDARRMLRRALESACTGRVSVTSDAAIAHLGALAGRSGVVVCAGTGSVAVGGTPPELVLFGGGGFLIDDTGSSYDIGRRAVRRALYRRDVGASSGLADALEDAAGHDLRGLVARVHADPVDRTLLAGLAPVVTALDDADATAVVDEAAHALGELALRGVAATGCTTVSYSGGVFNAERIRQTFIDRTGAVTPLATPEIGALLVLGREP